MRKWDVYRRLLKSFPLVYIFCLFFLSDIRKNNFSGRTTSGGTFFCGFPRLKGKAYVELKLKFFILYRKSVPTIFCLKKGFNKTINIDIKQIVKKQYNYVY